MRVSEITVTPELDEEEQVRGKGHRVEARSQFWRNDMELPSAPVILLATAEICLSPYLACQRTEVTKKPQNSTCE